jgi:hypothetical protein
MGVRCPCQHDSARDGKYAQQRCIEAQARTIRVGGQIRHEATRGRRQARRKRTKEGK